MPLLVLKALFAYAVNWALAVPAFATVLIPLAVVFRLGWWAVRGGRVRRESGRWRWRRSRWR